MQNKNNESNIISVKRPNDMVLELDRLVKHEDFENRSHAIRTFLKRDLDSSEGVACNA
jgi:Arc/MetJ-type ribon-helix-helix transcriptional regulator